MKTQNSVFNIEPKDILSICTYMFVFSITLSTLLITYFQQSDISKIYSGLIILLVGIPFGICALITSMAIYKNSSNLWNLSKLGLVFSYILLFIVILWIGSVVLLGINIQFIFNSISPLLLIIIICGYIFIAYYGTKEHNKVVSIFMRAFFSLSKEVSYYDTVMLIFSTDGLLIEREILFGSHYGDIYNDSLIKGVDKISLSIKDIEKDISDYAKNRSIILIIEGEENIRKIIEIIRKANGDVKGCIIARALLSDNSLDALKKEFKIPFKSIP